MKDIAIFGAGGFGREVACLIKRINNDAPTWNLIGFFDDGKSEGVDVIHSKKVLGGIDALNNWDKELAVVIAIGNPNVVKTIVGRITNANIFFPNIIHPQVNFSDKESFSIGHGNIIQRDCSFSCNVTLGNFNTLNASVVFGHDDNVGSFNSFMPAVRISGEVKIQDCNFFGVGSIVLQQIKIGNHLRLGAGSVLMTKPKDSNLYIGIPAKIFKI